jgi:hypothetical protein
MGQFSANGISGSKQIINLEPLSRPSHTADIQEALAAVIATTRREWMLPLAAPSAAGNLVVKRNRIARRSIRFSPDATRSAAWSVSVSPQERVDSLLRSAELDNPPEGAS